MAQEHPNHNPKVVRGNQPHSGDSKITAGKVAKTVVFSIGKVILTLLLIVIIVVCVVGTAMTVFVMKYVNSDSTIDLENVQLGFTTAIYATDQNGDDVILQTIAAQGEREWVDYDEIPQHVIDAFTCAEDERFLTHEGVDWKRTIGSFINEFIPIYSSRQGGSTITQQLIKNINQDFNNRTKIVKLQEILGALNLERHYTKAQIMEAYLNCINLGNGAYGVQAASLKYFGKDVSELTIAEAASLACSAKSPETLNPADGPNNEEDPDYYIERREYVLGKMLEYDKVTMEEYQEAMDEKVKANKPEKEDKDESQGTFSWYVDAVYNQVVADLQEAYGYDADTARAKIGGGGLQIYTPMNLQVQDILETAFLNDETFSDYEVEIKPQAAMVVMDYEGNVLGLVGGRGKKEGNLVFNRATQDPRSPGSCMKPITTYGPALQSDLITWSTTMMDEPKRKKNSQSSEPDFPRNWNDVWEEKPFTMVDALKLSKNTIPVEIAQLMGPEYGYYFLEDELGITSMDPDTIDMADSLTLGMMNTGVYLDELTAAYQIFGNGGFYYEPMLYTKVTDSSGKVLLEKTDQGSDVLDRDTSYIMNKMMEQVVVSGTGTDARISGMTVVGKTGSTDDNKELTFVGLTPYLVGGIRFGFDQGSKEAELVNGDLSGTGYKPQYVWRELMLQIHEELAMEPCDFELDSSNVVTKSYCEQSGMLATSQCSKTKVGYYKQNRVPSVCAMNHAAQKDKDKEKEERQHRDS